MKFFIYDNTYILINNLLPFFIKTAKECIKQKGKFTIALSGGKTPVEFYTRLSSINDFDLWDNTYIFLTDERFVPSDHPDSNFQMISDQLLSFIPIPEKNIFPILTNTDSAETSALYYEGMVQEFFQLPVGTLPKLDLILLGLGEDGHTASLFPGNETLNNSEHIAISTEPAGVKHSRISLSMPVINQARTVVFLITGKQKSNIVKTLMQRDISIPASHVNPANGELYLYLDAKAASSLPKDKALNEGEALIIEI